MGQHVSRNAVALRVVLFFARNPEEHLLTQDVSEKFGMPAKDVVNCLRRPVEDGMLAKVVQASGKRPGRGQEATYAAGPRLLEMIGEKRAERVALMVVAEACVPVGG